MPLAPRRWRQGTRVRPEAAAGSPRLALGRGEIAGVGGVAFEPPRETLAHQFETEIAPGHRDAADDAAVPVGAHDLHGHDPAKDLRGGEAPSCRPERLPLLGAVDPPHPHAHGAAIPHHLDGVAVANGDADTGEPFPSPPRRGEEHSEKKALQRGPRGAHERMVTPLALPVARHGDTVFRQRCRV